MATHSSTLGWQIPWKEEPGWLQSTGSQRVGHDRATSLHFLSLFYLRWKHFVSLSLLPSAPPPIHPVFDMNSSLCLGPVDFLPWLHLETIQISSPDRTETKSEGSWKKTMRHKKRMKKFPITVSSKILPLWGDPRKNTHWQLRFSPLSYKKKESRNKCSLLCLLKILVFWTSLVV